MIYDVTIRQFDTSFWAQLAGTTTVASNKLRNSSATIASYILMEFPDIEFAITNAVAPTGGQDKIWGCFSPSTVNWGAYYFQITGSTFQAVVVDTYGNTVTKALTWSAGYTATQTLFRIHSEPSQIQFLINGVVVATFEESTSPSLPGDPAPIYIHNGNADNFDLAYVGVRRAAGMV